MKSPYKQLGRLALIGLGLVATNCLKQSEDSNREASVKKASLGSSSSIDGIGEYGTVTNVEDVCDATGAKGEEELPSLSDVLPECGIDDISDRNRSTFSTKMSFTYDRLINAGVAVATVPLTTILDLKGTLAETTLDVTVNVGTVSGTINGTPVAEADLGPIMARAEDIAKIFRGPVTGYSEPLNSNYSKDWRGIFCSIPKSKNLKNTRNGFATEVDFYPAYVPNISPIADRVRYEKELGDYRFFKDIKATVTSTNNPLLTKKEYTGSILVERIPNVRETPRGTIRGDSAFRVTNRFGSEPETLALGFHLWTEYYIDHGQRSFSNIIANVGDDDLMYFIGTYVGESEGPTSTAKANYTADIKPILDAQCTGCHSSSGAPRVNLSSYTAAKNAGDAANARVQAGTMPPTGALNAAQKALFKAWKDTGYPEN